MLGSGSNRSRSLGRGTMNRFARALAFAVVLAGSGAALAADPTTLFVSGDGDDDLNTCTTPLDACRNLNVALGRLSPGGVIHVLPGEYSPFIIDQAVDLIADSGQASIVSAGHLDCGAVLAEICVNAGPTAVVRIRGLTISQANGSSFAAI